MTARDSHRSAALSAVQLVVRQFFEAFTAGPGLDGRMNTLRRLLADEARFMRVDEEGVTIYDAETFIEPRRALLQSGDLMDFREWPTTGSFDLFGDMAHWFGAYRKSWRAGGDHFTGAGMKSIQCVRTTGEWKISTVMWEDERDGLLLRDHIRSQAI